MRIRLAAALAIAALALTPARADVLVRVDKSAQLMTVTVDGMQRYVWPVSTGIADYDTPDGEFRAFRMEKDHFSREWDDAPMPYSIFFTEQGHAIHGTYHKSLGRPASHGCVRLPVANAATLFAVVKQQGLKQTKVVLVGELPDHFASGAIARAEPPLTYAESRRKSSMNYYQAPPYYYDPGRYEPPRRYYRGLFGWSGNARAGLAVDPARRSR